MDLTLPYIKMSETAGIPEVAGVALFSGKDFTGHTLDKKESIIVQVLKKKPGKYTMSSLICGKKTVKRIRLLSKLIRYKKKWDIQDR